MTLDNITENAFKRYSKKAMGAAGAALLAATVACGGSPTGPTPPGPGPGPGPSNVSARVSATDTFTGSPLDVEYTIEGCGQKATGRTNGAPIQVQTCNNYAVRVNMTGDNQMSNPAYVPSIYENVNVGSNLELLTDLPQSSKLFGSIDPRWAIEVYRGRGNRGRNQVWRSQPSAWIVNDPDGVLSKYADPKNNPEFDTIMEGYRIVEDYTRGYIRAPSKDQVQLIAEPSRNIGNGEFYFRINTNPSEAEVKQGDIIVASGSSSLTDSWRIHTLSSEMVSSVQGGDSESDNYRQHGMNLRPLNDLDRIWGEFNYHKRQPGDVILPSGDAVPSPYGFPVEIRKR